MSSCFSAWLYTDCTYRPVFSVVVFVVFLSPTWPSVQNHSSAPLSAPPPHLPTTSTTTPAPPPPSASLNLRTMSRASCVQSRSITTGIVQCSLSVIFLQLFFIFIFYHRFPFASLTGARRCTDVYIIVWWRWWGWWGWWGCSEGRLTAICVQVLFYLLLCLYRLFVCIDYLSVSIICLYWLLVAQPWYKRTGWLGVKHKVTYLRTYSWLVVK